MSISRFVLLAIPAPYWEKELEGVDISRFAHDALECERRIGKEVNLENEYARYTLLCQQLEREVINSGKMKTVEAEQEFKDVVENGRFAASPMQPGYLALLSRGNQETATWRLGNSFFLPKYVEKHLDAFTTWVNKEGVGETTVVRQRISFFQWAKAMNCGVLELQSGFHLVTEKTIAATQLLSPEIEIEGTGQYIEIPEFVRTGIDVEFFGQKGPKQHSANVLRKQIQNALQSGEPVSFGNQAPHDVIAEVLNEFVFVPVDQEISPVNLRVMYADGAEAEPFPLFCLPKPQESERLTVDPLRVALMSMRHLEMDPQIDFCWFRNREVSRTRTLSETDQFCFSTTIEQLSDSLQLGELRLNLFHTGFEPAVIGFYRGVVHKLLDIHRQGNKQKLSITPLYFRGEKNPYQTGNVWQ